MTDRERQAEIFGYADALMGDAYCGNLSSAARAWRKAYVRGYALASAAAWATVPAHRPSVALARAVEALQS